MKEKIKHQLKIEKVREMINPTNINCQLNSITKETYNLKIKKMRTVTLLGLTCIAEAINKDYMPESMYSLFAFVLMMSILMDIIEFINKARK